MNPFGSYTDSGTTSMCYFNVSGGEYQSLSYLAFGIRDYNTGGDAFFNNKGKYTSG